MGVTCYFLLSAMMCDEVVAAAVPAIKESADLDSSQVGLLYSSSFVPSLTFVVLGGLLHHKIGVRALSIFSSLSVVVGMVVFAMSTTFWGMIAGRVLFGLGLGPTELVNDMIALRWFDNESSPSIEIAFGLIGSFGMLGFVLAFNLIPSLLNLFSHMANAEALRMAVLCLSIIPAVTVVINIYYIVLDWYAEPILELDLVQDDEEPSILESVKQLPLSYWLLFTINASSFALMYVIMLYSVDFMVEKWKYDDVTAGRYSSGVYIAGIILSPLTGVMIHKFGKMITIIFLGLVLFGVGCLLLGITAWPPLIGLLCKSLSL
uniref:Lysosomal dipeptide transporter MFSD1 n=1 Tax=Arcella intermedia TaxID=1963864 RepID=A0A6B2L9Z2_9EUKA